MSGVLNVQVDGKAAEAAVERTSGALATIFGPVARELGLAWGERAAFYRLRQSLEIHEKTLKLRERYPTPPEMQRSIPESEGVRALETASLEAEPAVQDLWANLIRNATDQRTRITIEKSFVELLGSLSAPEALFLKGLNEAWAIENERVKESKSAISIYQDAIASFEKQGLPIPDSVVPPKTHEIDERAHTRTESIFSEGWRKFDITLREFSIRNLVRIGLIDPIQYELDFRPYIHGTEITALDSMGSKRRIDVITPSDLKDIIRRLMTEISLAISEPEFDLEAASNKKVSRRTARSVAFPELNFSLSPLATRLIMACSPPAGSI